MTKDTLPFAKRLIIHAPNVHSGGGAVLLNAILENSAYTELILICDQRMVVNPLVEAELTVFRVEPTFLARIAAEHRLRKIAGNADVVLAFGNLPPFYRLQAQTVLFLQNRYLVDPTMSLGGFGHSARLRLIAERIWLRSRICNADQVFVQTASMAALFKHSFGRVAEVVPFAPLQDSCTQALKAPVDQYDFIYVSSGEPHKNHPALIEAWGILADNGLKPTLALTLAGPRNLNLLRLIEISNTRRGTRIINLDELPPKAIRAAYKSARALIFPSLGESLGLPLIEAAEFGLPILASELDFVRDVARPAETFDPHSPRSIARAVRRFMSKPDDLCVPLTVAAFLKRIREERS